MKPVSLIGNIALGIVSLATNNPIGQGFKDGHLKKNMTESPMVFPEYMENRMVELKNCKAEWLFNHAFDDGKNAGKVILQLHGGGFLFPLRNPNRRFAGLFTEVSDGASVLSPDYRVLPEARHPQGLEDCIDAYEYLILQGYKESDIIVVGDSAGGTLVEALLLYLRDQGRALPTAQVLISPSVDMTHSGESFTTNFKCDPLFGNTDRSMLFNTDYAGDHDLRDKYLSPLFGDLTGFPTTLIQVGNIEMLYSDSMELAKKLRAGGTKVHVTVFDKMFHEFQQMSVALLPESKDSWKEIGSFIRSIWKEEK